jgi:type I restriction enzyme, S subunit
MTEDWQRKPLRSICAFVRGPFGGSLKKSAFIAEGFAVYEQQHAIYNQFDEIRYFISEKKFDEMQRFELRPNDLIMSCSGTMGRVAIVPDGIQRGVINQALLKLTPSSLISVHFLKYWMESVDFQLKLKEQSGGAAIQNVASVSVLKEIKMPVPPVPEQQRIVGILDEAFEGIATAKANAEKNLQNARALFESHLQSVFLEHVRRWTDRRLADVVTRLTNGYVGPTRNIYIENGVPYLLARHVKNNQLAFDGKTFISDEFNSKNRKSKLKVGDVLLVQSGHIGHSAVVPPEHQGHNCHAMIVITPVEETLDGHYLSLYFNSAESRSKFKEIRSGSTVPHLTCREVRELLIPLPDLTTQQRIVGNAKEIRDETDQLQAIYRRKLRALEALKNSLLHQAFTGKL